MNDARDERRAELAGRIEQLLKDRQIRTVDAVCVELKEKRGVQRVLETDKRFRLVAPGRASSEHRYTLVNLPSQPAAETRGTMERPNYVEVWTNSPFKLLHRSEPLTVDVANLLGRRCGGMIHEGGKCPKPAPLWPLLVMLAEAKTSRNHVAFFADASTRHHVQGKESFEELVEAGAVMEVPASYTADSKLLAWADKNNSAILTDDIKMRGQYAELYPWTNDPTRFIGHMIDDEAHKEMSYVRKRLPQAPPKDTRRIVSASTSSRGRT